MPETSREPVVAYSVPSTNAPIDLHLERNEGDVPGPVVLEALREAWPHAFRCYPDASSLQQVLAEVQGVAPEQVLVTAGGDEAIDRFFRATVAEGQDVIVPVPTFDMIEPYARLARGTVKPVSWPHGPFPVDAVLDAVTPRTAAIVMISPNNPTGAVARPPDLQRLAAETSGCRILVDSAYAEFADDDLTPTALGLSNAVVIRTLSKAWGLAGLRVGYAVGHPLVIAQMRASGGPYSVAGPSLAVAEACLLRTRPQMEAFVRRVKEERETLFGHLESLGAEPLPSQANFVLARYPDADRVWRGLAGLGIAVRAFPNRAGLAQCLRITCPGNEAILQRLLDALTAVMAPRAVLFQREVTVTGGYPELSSRLQGRALALAVVETSTVPVRRALGDARHAWMVARSPDLLRAARAEGVVPVGLLAPGEDALVVAPSLLEAGAAWVLGTLNELEELLPEP